MNELMNRLRGSIDVHGHIQAIKRTIHRVELIEEQQAIYWLNQAKDHGDRQKVKECYAAALQRIAKRKLTS